MDDDPHDLERFVTAQAGVYETALEELRRGRKESHWMWFVFPQLAGLGGSPMAEVFAIASLDEARAYLAHPLLGARLTECVGAVTAVDGRSAVAIFGFPDVLKFRSCLTLFAHAAPHEPAFAAALAKYYDGQPDERSLALLGLA
ncbi:MAG TPA: DUF1810 domain-containing protein [Caulobacteraceae bacterium]|jgi:uncharacterized protein (DUF1810 family)|nr:DUF1810 domain-containing protein [Caulobacteraceae bacterium]